LVSDDLIRSRIFNSDGTPAGDDFVVNGASVSVAENTTAVTTIGASDPDAGDVISFAIVGGEDATVFTIHETSGALSFVAAPDFEAPTDSDGNNVYEVIIQADDGWGGTDTRVMSVMVTNEADVLFV
jgi:hypothetical protein